MDKEWVNNKNNEAKAKRPELLTNLKNKLIESNLFDDTMIEYIISGSLFWGADNGEQGRRKCLPAVLF